MKYLTLIRHAKSSWDDATTLDHDRPLNERGLRNAPVVGRFLAKTYFGANGTPPVLAKPDALISSTAMRARATAEIFSRELKVPTLSLERRLYLADPKAILQAVRGFDDSLRHVMIFGHNPGISECAEHLIKRGGIEEMPTCAAVIIELPWDHWSATSWEEGRLIGYVTPKLIEKRFAEDAKQTA
jgi:phosphohistidine phosphatase